MRKICVPAAILVVLASSGWAQVPSSFSVKLTVSGVAACNNSAALTLGTNATFTASSNTGTPRAGSINVSDISLTRTFDGCSIALYNALFTEKRLQSVIISAFNGTTEVLRVTLTNAGVTGISDAAATNAPLAEKVSFNFDRIEFFDVVTNTRVGYDLGTNRTF
jgi:type VI protein secretion system component Hcp